MARILFGGPQEKEMRLRSLEHDDLIKRLRKVHEVNYLARADSMFNELKMISPGLNDSRAEKEIEPVKPYDLIIYDTQLFYINAKPQERARIFKNRVIDLLKFPKIPVIILTDEQIAREVADSVPQEDFRQINKPYQTEKVLEAVNDILK